MSCGIYCIENKVNGKKYIGQSINIEKRWETHKINLRTDKHVNNYLQRAWNKYGEDSFSFYVVEICVPESLNEREKYWIEYYDSFNNGFNLTLGGDGGNTIVGYTEEELQKYKEKKRKIHQETSLKGEEAPCSKLTKLEVEEIIQRMLNGEFSIDIANDYNVNYATIHDIRAHNTWNSLTDGIEFPHPYKSRVKGIRGKAINQYDIYGNYIDTYISARDAEQKTGCSYKHISSVCRGKRKTCGGYIWKFADGDQETSPINSIKNSDVFIGVQNSKPIARISEDGILIKTFNSIAEAARFYGISESGIGNVCKHKSKQTYGMIFKFLTLDELITLS